MESGWYWVLTETNEPTIAYFSSTFGNWSFNYTEETYPLDKVTLLERIPDYVRKTR